MTSAYDPQKINVAVVGGGIGGLCAAIGLLKYPHVNVQVYEAAHKFSEIGAGVAFGPNAQRALKFISSDTEHAFKNVVTGNIWKKHQNVWFEFYYGQGSRAGELISVPKNSTGQCSLHRAKFLDELVKLVPVGISHFGKRLVEIDEQRGGQEPLTLKFKDGTTAPADCVLGCDGVHSAARHHLFGDKYEPRFSGVVAWRGLIPMTDAKAALGEERAENSFNYVGRGASVMTYPIDGGETMNIVASDTSRTHWEGPWVVPADYEEVRDTFAGWDETPRKIIDLLLNVPDTKAWALWDLPPLDAYTAPMSTIALLGDAAHATTPFQGQGAGQAIEDAYVIEELLGKVTDKAQIPLAFKAYDIIRRPRSLKIVSTSREAIELMSLKLEGVDDDPAKLKEHIDWRFDWIWNRDIEGESRDAIATFEHLLDPQLGK